MRNRIASLQSPVTTEPYMSEDKKIIGMQKAELAKLRAQLQELEENVNARPPSDQGKSHPLAAIM